MPSDQDDSRFQANREGDTGEGSRQQARVPPRWFVRLAWYTHRGLYRLTGGRVGLWRPKPDRWGAMRLTTTGRRTGQERSVILGYYEEGPNLITMAMNGWADGEPAWWLNLQANPVAAVDLAGDRRMVRARAAQGEERTRLWEGWRRIDPKLDAFAALRSAETAVVILEPVSPAPEQQPDRRPRP